MLLANGEYPYSGSVWLRRNTGAGAFVPAIAVPVPVGLLKLGDVDGDGDLDIVSLGTTACAICLNDGAGNFTSTGTVAPTGGGYLNLADLDSDGDLDMLVGSTFSGNNLQWCRNDGTGSFGPSQIIGASTTALAVGDVDNDGDLDLVSGDGNLYHLTRGQVDTSLNDGTGTFRRGASFHLSVNQFQLAAGDIDADDDAALLIGTGPLYTSS